MNQIDQITAPSHSFLETDDELELLALSNRDFSEGVGRLILHMLDKKDRVHNTGSFSGNIVTGGTNLEAILAENSEQLLQE